LRLQLIEPDRWGFADLGEGELSILRDIAQAGDPSGCESAENRLFQRPFDHEPKPGDIEEHQSLADWEDFVTDSFRDEFRESVAIVTSDLSEVQRIEADATDESVDASPTYVIELPQAHAERWFGALNQARLVLAERYRLFNSEGNSIFSFPEIDGLPENDDDGDSNDLAPEEESDDRPLVYLRDDPEDLSIEFSPQERFEAYLKSQMYAFIQEWLVEFILSKGLE